MRIILQSDDAEDHLSEPSDYGDTESIQPAPDGNNGVNNLPADQNPPESVRGRRHARVHAQGPGRDMGRGHGRGHKRGRGQVDRQNERILQLSMRYKTC